MVYYFRSEFLVQIDAHSNGSVDDVSIRTTNTHKKCLKIPYKNTNLADMGDKRIGRKGFEW